MYHLIMISEKVMNQSGSIAGLVLFPYILAGYEKYFMDPICALSLKLDYENHTPRYL